MGKVARISLSTSQLRFGGGRYGRVARQTIREHADAKTTNRIFLDALLKAQLDTVPDERHRFTAFFMGPLLDIIEEKLGEHLRDKIREAIAEAIKPVSSFDSGVQDKLDPNALPMRVVLVGAAPDREDAVEAALGDHQLVRVRDVLDVLGAVTNRANMAVVIDGAVAVIPAALRMLARILPPGTPVLQWGGKVVIDRPEGLCWTRLDSNATAAEVARHCLPDFEAEADAGPTKILVADDDPTWREALTRRLNSEGYDVISAVDGAAALEACLDHEPAVVLSDYNMPNLDGSQLAALVRQRLAAKAPPLLLVTSEQLDARDLPGVVAVISKSADFDVILRRVRRLLRRRRGARR